MEMRIPQSGRKTALLIIDVQPDFLNKRTRHIVKNIVTLLNEVEYDLYCVALFHAEKGSLWDRQTGWLLKKDKDTHLARTLQKVLPPHIIHIDKQSKSVFKGNKDLQTILKKNNIKEIHIVGLDTNDCILASAFEAFDLGFFTYVIEECCDANSSAALNKKALSVLRKQKITNNSSVENISFLTI